jgi:phosphatidylserine decarboxylase
MERLFSSFVARKASHAIGRLADIELPSSMLMPFIKIYATGFQVSLDDAEVPEQGFQTFGEFFGRRLKPGLRPISENRSSLISPCDGEIVSMGEINPGQNPSFSIKGFHYNIGGLLGASGQVDQYSGGGFMVIYLHPRDYHRVHSPVEGSLCHVRHIPGAFSPVASWSERRIEGIYQKNERVVFQLSLPSDQSMALVMVAAFGVGNIASEYCPEHGASSRVCRERAFDPSVTVDRGDELGAFLLGSTVVMLWSQGAIKLDESLLRGATMMGTRLGQIVG